MVAACLLSALSAGAQSSDATLSGRVVDARTGEPIAKALVSLRALGAETRTDDDGRFTLKDVPPGAVDIYVSTVGYGLVKRSVSVPHPGELTIPLGQEAIKRSDEVSVTADVYELQNRGAASELTLDNTELENLASVLADDPLRSVQALPGVVTGDDFHGTFSVRGAGFQSVGFYIDGVLTASPFHTIRDVNDGYSLTILNGDLLQSVSLLSSAAPAGFGDRLGAVLNVETRDGSLDRRFTRAHLGASGVSFSSEGPIGGRTSWLLAGRKSFLDYLRTRTDSDLAIGYYDVQAKLTRRSGPHSLSLFALHGSSTKDESSGGVMRPPDGGSPDQGPNPGPIDGGSQDQGSMARADAATQLVSARWRYAPSARTLLLWSASFERETGERRDAEGNGIYHSDARHSALRVDLVRKLGQTHTFEAGALGRRVEEDAAEQRLRSDPEGRRPGFDYDRASWQPGLYAQDTWATGDGRLTATLGVRGEYARASHEGMLLPRGSVTYALTPRFKLSAAAGRYAQSPSLARLFGDLGNPSLRAERSDQYVLAFERLLGERTRVRVELYDHEDRNRLYAPDSEFRRQDGRIVAPDPAATFQNSVSGHSRGFEAYVQRRSANRVSGWLSYAYGRTRYVDAITGKEFASDFDQTHTLNAYLSLRLDARLNLSAKYRYGSNVPLVGFYDEAPDGRFVLGERRNRLRVPAYSRLDVRANRAFFLKRSKLTLYAEVLNVLNRANYRYTGANVDRRSGGVDFDRDELFPLLPMAGLTIEF